MMYKVLFEKKAEKELKKIDTMHQKIILNWVTKNLENTTNPRAYCKPLKSNFKEYWRYRIGGYRLVADIDDNKIKILIIDISHRKDAYKKL